MGKPVLKIYRKVAFLLSTVGQKSQNMVVTHPSTPLFFCRHSLQLLSSTLPKLMNWMLLSPSPLSPDPDTPSNLERAQSASQIRLRPAIFATLNSIQSVPIFILMTHTSGKSRIATHQERSIA